MCLLPSPELGCSQLLKVELLPLLDQLLPLVLQRFPLTIHNSFQFLEVSQLYLQLFHLRFNQKRHEGLDLALFHSCQVLCLDSRCTQSSCGRRRKLCIFDKSVAVCLGCFGLLCGLLVGRSGAFLGRLLTKLGRFRFVLGLPCSGGGGRSTSAAGSSRGSFS